MKRLPRREPKCTDTLSSKGFNDCVYSLQGLAGPWLLIGFCMIRRQQRQSSAISEGSPTGTAPPTRHLNRPILKKRSATQAKGL